MKTNLLILINESLLDSELALKRATGDNIDRHCREYLSLLAEYRDKLYQLRGSPEINLHQSSDLIRELVEQVRKAIRSAVEFTVKERNQTEALLKSFTNINGYEAAKTLNQLKYKGFDNWELRAGGVRSERIAGNEKLSIQEAVDTAGKLRREAYADHKITFLN